MNIHLNYLNGVLDCSWLFNIDNYNNFFYPNICHVCKKTKGGALISCDQCCMISYCSDEHKSEHRGEHQQFCEYITRYLRKKPHTEWRFMISPTQVWIQSRYEFLHEIKKQFPRKMYPYEKQMIIFAKSCGFCHQQDHLQTCLMCYSVNYCVEHKQIFQSNHASQCRKLLLCLNLNLVSLLHMEISLSFCQSLVERTSIDNMGDFIIHQVRDYRNNELEELTDVEYLYSDYASGPLTLYYGMKEADLLGLLSLNGRQSIVHVVEPNHFERKYVAAWELLLHGLRHIEQLKIVLIGPKLEAESEDMKVCFDCSRRKQRFLFECCPMFYYDYVRSPSFQYPDMIVSFNVDFRKEGTWSKSLLAQNKNCPLLLTATREDIAKNNVNNVQQLLGPAPSSFLYSIKNKFKSLMPRRCLETGYVYYRNKHVTIYRNLLSSQ